MQIKCSGCSTTIGVPEEAAGKKVRCPKCQAVVAVPAAGRAAAGNTAVGNAAAGNPAARPKVQASSSGGPMIASCPHCAKKVQVPSGAAGKKVKCPGCSNPFAVPAANAQSAAAERARPAAVAANQPAANQASGASSANGWVPPWETQQTFAPSVMDELTDADMTPVKEVNAPQPKRSNAGANAALGQHVSGKDKSEMDNASRRRAAKCAPVALRIIATSIDWIFAHAPPFALMIALFAYYIPKQLEGEGDADPEKLKWIAVIAFMVCELVMHLLNGFIVKLRGQTIGKLLTGIVIVDASTLLPVGFQQGFLERFVFWQFQKIGIWGSIKQFKDVLALFTNEGITLHDEYANTYVIRRRDIGKMA